MAECWTELWLGAQECGGTFDVVEDYQHISCTNAALFEEEDLECLWKTSLAVTVRMPIVVCALLGSWMAHSGGQQSPILW